MFHSSSTIKKIHKQTTSPLWIEAEDVDFFLTRSSSKETSSSSNSVSSSETEKNVRFGDCSVRCYPQVLGDHPYCSLGCPLELGWKYFSKKSCTVEDFELHHKKHRSLQELRLTPEERRSILEDKYTDQQVRKACRRTSRGCMAYKREQRQFFAGSS
jgi:hypothetical protein